MKNVLSLEDRIRSVRRGFRSGQPLDYRIQIVRERHQAAKKRAEQDARKNLHRGN